jgi:hypothetical protein
MHNSQAVQTPDAKAEKQQTLWDGKFKKKRTIRRSAPVFG